MKETREVLQRRRRQSCWYYTIMKADLLLQSRPVSKIVSVRTRKRE